MITLHRILVPTDFSEPSMAAATYGVALARAFSAKLHVLHVEPRHDLEIMVERELVVERLLSETTSPHVHQNAARELLRKILTEQEAQEFRAEYVLRAGGLGGPYAEIVRYAKERDKRPWENGARDCPRRPAGPALDEPRPNVRGGSPEGIEWHYQDIR